jgi:cytochrome c biogenesis protein CcmG/thiol:disulfide interchange protein DsbE
MLKTKINQLWPFLILFSLLFFLAYELLHITRESSDGRMQLTSALIGKTVPTFNLPNLHNGAQQFSAQDLMGKVALLNVWASWCYACANEHAVLMKIARDYHIPIYSINYRDNRAEALQWLKERGDPYVATGFDQHGDAGIDLGIYGTPETFVLNPTGQIIYRQVGAISEREWQEKIFPLLKPYLGQKT